MTSAQAPRGHRKRDPQSILNDLEHALTWFSAVVERGIGVEDLPAIQRSAEGVRRLIAEVGEVRQ